MTNHIETACAALLKIWPDGAQCSHAHAREAFAALDAAHEQVAALPADWRTDSSLETWFPFTAQELVNLREEGKTYSIGMNQMATERDAAIAERDRLLEELANWKKMCEDDREVYKDDRKYIEELRTRVDGLLQIHADQVQANMAVVVERDAAIAERDRFERERDVAIQRDHNLQDAYKYKESIISERERLLKQTIAELDAATARAEDAERRIAQLVGLLRKIKDHSSRVNADGDFYAAFNWRYLDEITAALSESWVVS